MRAAAAPGPRRRLWWAAAGLTALLALTAGLYWRRRAEPPAIANPPLLVIAAGTGRADNPRTVSVMQAGLQLMLEQSPYLRLTTGSVPEACQANPAADIVKGTVEGATSDYRLRLTLVNCSGQQQTAPLVQTSPDASGLLAAVSDLASSLRRRLGEPMSTLSQFNIPIAQGASASLPALASYAQGEAAARQSSWTAAIRYASDALKADPNFALAFAQRGAAEWATGAEQAAQADYTQAYVRRLRLSQPRRLQLVASYDEVVGGDWLQAERDNRAWSHAYPADRRPGQRLCRMELQLGQLEAASSDCRGPQRGLAVQLAGGPGPGTDVPAGYLRQPGDLAAANAGHLRELQARLKASSPPDPGGWLQLGLAQALLGLHVSARESAAHALRVSREQATLAGAALIYALARSASRAEALDTELEQRFGQTSIARWVQLPVNRAWVALSRHQSTAALGLLAPSLPYARGLVAAMAPLYVQAEALRAAGKLKAAAADYQEVIAYSLANPWSEVSRLGLARVQAALGERAQARVNYQQLLAHWQSADPGLPLVRTARRELARFH